MQQNFDEIKEASKLKVEVVLNERYKVISLLGSGGMGSVYKVQDLVLDKIFAVKVLNAKLTEDQAAFRRFTQEAKASSELNHVNIVNVYEQGTTAGGEPFLVMDFLEGETLSDLLKKEGRLPYSRALDIFGQICEAIGHAHSKGVVHRDVKPGNIMLTTSESEVDLVKVVDFGIAKVLPATDAKTAALTQTGEIFGSPMYMSPEQCNGDPLDARSDFYSLGCLMFEILTGRSPFAAENPFKVMLNQVQMAPPAMRSVAGKIEIPEGLETVVLKCLEKNPAHRYQNAAELQADLKRVQEGKPPLAVRRSKPADKKTLAVAAAVVALIATAGLITSFNMTQTVSPPAEQTQTATEPDKPETLDGKTLAQWSAEIEQDPENAQLFFDRGRLHDHRDERTDAIQDYSKALVLNPKFTEAYRARAYVYTMVNEYDKATADANWLINDEPDWAEGYEVRSFVEMAEDNTEKAIEDARKSISLQPVNNETRSHLAYQYYYLASALINAAKYDEAIATATKGLSLADDEGNSTDSLYAARGLALCHMQKFDEALKDLKVAANTSSKAPNWSLVAYAYVGLGNLPEAEKALKKMEQLETFPARAHRLKGEVHRTAGQFEKALEDFSAETSLEQYAPGYRQKATCYISLGQLHSALDDLQRSNKINPTSPITLSYLARIEEQLDHTAQAKEHIKQSIDKSSNPVVLANAADVALHQGKNDEALSYVNKSLAGDPYMKEAYETRSRVYEAMGKTNEADQDRAKSKKLISHMDF